MCEGAADEAGHGSMGLCSAREQGQGTACMIVYRVVAALQQLVPWHACMASSMACMHAWRFVADSLPMRDRD